MALKRDVVLVLALMVVFHFEIQICTFEMNRKDFPDDFIFGTASSAAQFEGAANEDGKGQSVWDTFSHIPGKIRDFSNVDVGVDQYHRFKTGLGPAVIGPQGRLQQRERGTSRPRGRLLLASTGGDSKVTGGWVDRWRLYHTRLKDGPDYTD
ncbi:hypothetical protein RIF29_35554 [Crotalaria pallida]|uniref:Thioglucosidase n=1 Tax=Crotalaria pallida TaxID=3830 RepID=A0AAN9HY06_CROPI